MFLFPMVQHSVFCLPFAEPFFWVLLPSVETVIEGEQTPLLTQDMTHKPLLPLIGIDPLGLGGTLGNILPVWAFAARNTVPCRSRFAELLLYFRHFCHITHCHFFSLIFKLENYLVPVRDANVLKSTSVCFLFLTPN